MLPPNSVLYIGCIGDDNYGEKLAAVCKDEGIRVEYRIDTDHPTGRCGVIITGHNRSMCTDLGAANHYKLEHLKSPKIWKLVEEAEYYYVGGYHLTVCVPAILALAEEAAAKDKPFVMNISAPFIPQFFKDQLDSTSEYWDYIIGNETEAEAYATAHDLGVYRHPQNSFPSELLIKCTKYDALCVDYRHLSHRQTPRQSTKKEYE